MSKITSLRKIHINENIISDKARMKIAKNRGRKSVIYCNDSGNAIFQCFSASEKIAKNYRILNWAVSFPSQYS